MSSSFPLGIHLGVPLGISIGVSSMILPGISPGFTAKVPPNIFSYIALENPANTPPEIS